MRLDHNLQIRIYDALASRSEPEGERVLARAYWSLLLLVMIVTSISAVAFGIWEFTRTPHPDAVEGIHPKQSLDRAAINAVVQGFDDRAKQFRDRLVAPVSAKDPS